MFNLVNFETGERFDNFPYLATLSYNIGVSGEFYPEFDCDTFLCFSRFKIPFNDDYYLGKTDDINVSDSAYQTLLKHYQDNYPGIY